MTVRVGVIADTHCPEFLDRLPAALPAIFEGVELIIHAGDVSSMATLAELERIAPVAAVRGDHDAALPLPSSRVIEVGGRRIGVIHGNRSHILEEPITFVETISLGFISPVTGVHGWLRRRFPDVDAVVYGHTHLADVRRVGGALIFNPGAVYQVTPAEARRRLTRGPGWFEWSWLQVMKYRRVNPSPSVGIIEISDGGLTASVIPL